MLKPHPSLDDLVARDKRDVAAGAILKFEGDEAPARFHVVDGWLAASKVLHDGERQVIDFVLPGETFDPRAADGKTSAVQIETLGAAVIVTISASVWAQLMQSDPGLRRHEELRERAAQARRSERMLRLGRSSAETRIAYTLIELCMRMVTDRAQCAGGFHVPLGQRDLGDFIGLSSVHVCRTLRRLNRLGMITTGDHMDIRIHDVAALADLAEVDLEKLRKEIIPQVA